MNDVGADSVADAVKFQTLNSDRLATQDAETVDS